MNLRLGGCFWRVVIGKPKERRVPWKAKERPIFKEAIVAGFRGFQLPEKK